MTKPITPDMLPESAIEAGARKYELRTSKEKLAEMVAFVINTAIESGEATFIEQQPAGPTWPYQGSAILIKTKGQTMTNPIEEGIALLKRKKEAWTEQDHDPLSFNYREIEVLDKALEAMRDQKAMAWVSPAPDASPPREPSKTLTMTVGPIVASDQKARDDAIWNEAVKAAAEVVRDNCEYVTSSENQRGVKPRMKGDLMSTAYVPAILSLTKPSEFVVVPREPTERMIKAGALTAAEVAPSKNRNQATSVYRAMLKAME